MGRLNASFCDIGKPTMAGSDARENESNVTPLDWPIKTSAKLQYA